MRDQSTVKELHAELGKSIRALATIWSNENVRNYIIAKSALAVYLSDTEKPLEPYQYQNNMESTHYCCRD